MRAEFSAGSLQRFGRKWIAGRLTAKQESKERSG